MVILGVEHRIFVQHARGHEHCFVCVPPMRKESLPKKDDLYQQFETLQCKDCIPNQFGGTGCHEAEVGTGELAVSQDDVHVG
mmetsp:Transcript_1679/g.2225  ORF Transcript_1679/g.2225 Transcript_1679/m.2225 type:complete len:82 (+) Transcript_1679:107-352(+)